MNWVNFERRGCVLVCHRQQRRVGQLGRQRHWGRGDLGSVHGEWIWVQCAVPTLICGFCFFRFFKHFCLLLFRRSARHQNVVVGAVPRAAPKLAAAQGRRPWTLLAPPIHSELLPTSWNKVLENSLKPVNPNRKATGTILATMKAFVFQLGHTRLIPTGKRQGPGTDSPAAKRLKMDPSSQSPGPSGKSTPQPPSGKSTPSSRYIISHFETVVK